MRAGGLVVGPEPSKLMARVQIPAGAFLRRTDVRSEIAGGILNPTSRSPRSEASRNVSARFKHRGTESRVARKREAFAHSRPAHSETERSEVSNSTNGEWSDP